MLIFGLPPSDPAPEFEPGLNLGSNYYNETTSYALFTFFSQENN